jgi:hypothetical protein
MKNHNHKFILIIVINILLLTLLFFNIKTTQASSELVATEKITVRIYTPEKKISPPKKKISQRDVLDAKLFAVRVITGNNPLDQDEPIDNTTIAGERVKKPVDYIEPPGKKDSKYLSVTHYTGCVGVPFLFTEYPQSSFAQLYIDPYNKTCELKHISGNTPNVPIEFRVKKFSDYQLNIFSGLNSLWTVTMVEGGISQAPIANYTNTNYSVVSFRDQLLSLQASYAHDGIEVSIFYTVTGSGLHARLIIDSIYDSIQ